MNEPRIVSLPDCGITGLWSPIGGNTTELLPLLVCVHGGGYTHRYFDIPGASLIEAGNLSGFHVFSMDRPDYGGSQRLPKGDELILRNGTVLVAAIDELISRYAPGVSNVVLVGHSIGGAVAICASALQPSWLAGVAVSGVGLVPVLFKWLPPFRRVKLPDFLAVRSMFGPANSYDKKMAYSQLRLSSCSCVKQEMEEITTWWPLNLNSIAKDVRVPVDSAIAQYDSLWVVTSENVKNFGAAFVNSDRVDAYIVPDVGHCIEHHIKGADFHNRQLAFAAACCMDRHKS